MHEQDPESMVKSFLQYITLDLISQHTNQARDRIRLKSKPSLVDALLNIEISSYRKLISESGNLKKSDLEHISTYSELMIMMENCCSEGLHYVYDLNLRRVSVSNMYTLDSSSFSVELSDLRTGEAYIGINVPTTRKIYYHTGVHADLSETVDFTKELTRIDLLTAIKISILTGSPPDLPLMLDENPLMLTTPESYYTRTYVDDKEPDEGNVGACLRHIVFSESNKNVTLSHIRSKNKRDDSLSTSQSSQMNLTDTEFVIESNENLDLTLKTTKGVKFMDPLSIDEMPKEVTVLISNKPITSLSDMALREINEERQRRQQMLINKVASVSKKEKEKKEKTDKEKELKETKK
jgi:hypothetical protein